MSNTLDVSRNSNDDGSKTDVEDGKSAFTASPDMSSLQYAPGTKSEGPTRASTAQRPSFAHPHPATHPAVRFRTVVRKVMAMHRTSSMLARGGVGAEPGADPRRASTFVRYGHVRQDCLIEVADYSATRSSFGRMSNREFVKFLDDPGAGRREPWVKVRWINVGGVSWDVLSALALKYDMHPLALEDVLQQQAHGRSRADYYPKHLYLRVLSHSLYSDDETASPHASVTHLPRSESPEPMDGKWNGMSRSGTWNSSAGRSNTNGSAAERGRRGWSLLRRRLDEAADDYEMRAPQTPGITGPGIMDRKAQKAQMSRDMKVVRELKKGERVNVKIQPMSIFLYRDGTVISVHPDTRLEMTAPITERLRTPNTGLRSTADPSLLVESLLDLVVDQALEVVEDYQSKILAIEQAVLIKPTMKTVRQLHILQEDLILHKRTLEPIKTLVYGLRRYDDDRAVAIADRDEQGIPIRAAGYISQKSRIYFADVYDHMEYILTSLDMFAGICDNLVNYTFNMMSYEMNEVMRRLTLATIIFLPLGLLTGYFGMNFDNMWSVHRPGATDLLFWEIAIPVMAIVIPLFMFRDIKRLGHYVQKRMTQQSIVGAPRSRR
ncbi:hypothetical protein CERSUDRAFT_112973 [Gelatoporia subvermispora B]|uniref:Uncharacterized protein n=1 Tax=Ceriporiopsis subvermispora (strain B) TaxID=914234 RepID=M2PRT8_CERS8|nr:hypothetical protein CERSUDRAFT_112973 [Gelatoporia subvermispora B]